jgi:hypothetical protein
MHAYIVVSLMAGLCPEEPRGIGWEEEVALDGDPPWVAVLRVGSGRGRQEDDAEVPLRVSAGADGSGALREWQAAEREAAGSRWRDTGTVFTTAPGRPLGAGTSGGCFRAVRAGWAWQGLGDSGSAAHVRLVVVR